MPQCAGFKRNGEQCSASVPPGVTHCYNHDPLRANERRRNASRAGRRSSNGDIAEIRARLAALYEDVLNGELEPKVGSVLVQIANARTRLIETELRIKEQVEFEERLSTLEETAGKNGGRR